MKSGLKLLYGTLITGLIMTLGTYKTYAQNSGVGVKDPTHTFHIKPSDSNPVKDPIRLENLQPYLAQSDSMFVVVDPIVGVLKVVGISEIMSQVDNRLQTATEVELTVLSDADGDGVPEVNVQQAINALNENLPKGIFKTIGDARAAGLVDGDSFIAHPEGILGCAGCTIRLYPGMN